MPSINAYDTENFENQLKVICDAYGNYYEPDGNPDNLLKWLYSTACDLNFLYNIDYDAAIIFTAIMPDVDPYDNGLYHYKNYDIYYISNKSLTIKRHDSKTRTKILRIFDISQFYKIENGYQSLDKVATEILGYGKNQEELKIKREDIGQIKGYYEQFRDAIIKYCVNDANMTLRLAKLKIKSLMPILKGQIPKVYNSSASISKAYLSIEHPDLKYQYYNLLSQLSDWKKAAEIIENSYSGGIFYLHSLGKISKVYEYDINSAYPYAITQLYSLKDAQIKYVTKYEQSDYGFYHVRIKNLSDLPIKYRTGKTEITYIKNNEYVENYFTAIELEYFSKYHAKDIQFQVIEGVVINTHKRLEFADYNNLYNKRKEIKQRMTDKKDLQNKTKQNFGALQDNMLQWSFKTILNASYGVFAERKNGYTAFTNLIYASYITAMTRIKIYQLIDKIGWEHVKAVMTDAVLCDVEIKDNMFNSDLLGNFKLEGNRSFDEVWIYQNGIYISQSDNKITLHNRGFPSLTAPDMLFNATGSKLKIVRDTKVTKIKEGIIQHKQKDIGKFTKQTKYLDLQANRWKYLLEVDKLNFEYLKDHELKTDYMYNIDLQSEYISKPMLRKIDYSSLKKIVWQSQQWKIQETRLYDIKPIDYGQLIDKITSSQHQTRDFKRFKNRYQIYLDSDFRIIYDDGIMQFWSISDQYLYFTVASRNLIDENKIADVMEQHAMDVLSRSK